MTNNTFTVHGNAHSLTSYHYAGYNDLEVTATPILGEAKSLHGNGTVIRLDRRVIIPDEHGEFTFKLYANQGAEVFPHDTAWKISVNYDGESIFATTVSAHPGDTIELGYAIDDNIVDGFTPDEYAEFITHVATLRNRGDTGEPGEQGPRGFTGERGEQGQQGPQGERGPQGEQGPEGLQGIPGPDGPEGPSGTPGIVVSTTPPTNGEVWVNPDSTIIPGVDAIIDTSAGTKVTVGGVVVHYDSGWRNLTPYLSPGVTPSSNLPVAKFRRINNRVYVELKADLDDTYTGPIIIEPLPDSFLSRNFSYLRVPFFHTQTGAAASQLSAFAALGYAGSVGIQTPNGNRFPANSTVQWTFDYDVTGKALPTVLPSTPI